MHNLSLQNGKAVISSFLQDGHKNKISRSSWHKNPLVYGAPSFIAQVLLLSI